MGTPSSFSIDGNTTNQSIGASYLDISDAIQAEQARRFLKPASLPTIPENFNAAEQARQSSEQLAQVTQKPDTQRIIPTPLGLLLSFTGCTNSKERSTYINVGCNFLDYTDIQLAIETAVTSLELDYESELIVRVCDGTYSGFNVNYPLNVTIKAEEGHSPIIELDDDDTYPSIFFYNLSSFTLEGFEIYGADDYHAIHGQNLENVIISDVKIHNKGGGISIGNTEDYDSVSISISNTEIYNTNYSGIQIPMVGISTPIDVNLTNLEVYNTVTAISIAGGNVYLTASELNIHDNAASALAYDNPTSIYDGTYFAGGISIFSTEATISNSSFSNNTGYHGAAIYADGSQLTLTDTTIKNNTAINPNEIGGALQLVRSGTTVTTNNTDWSDNAPYDVSIQNPNDSILNTDYMYHYGTGASFICQYEENCTDL